MALLARHHHEAAGVAVDAAAGPALGLTQGSRHRCHADVAQLVAHHLAKVRVAGSNPVVRSEEASGPRRTSRTWQWWSRGVPAEWPSGLGKGLQSPVRGFDSRFRLGRLAQWESATLTR